MLVGGDIVPADHVHVYQMLGLTFTLRRAGTVAMQNRGLWCVPGGRESKQVKDT